MLIVQRQRSVVPEQALGRRTGALTIMYAFGTRPNFVKMAPVMRALRRRMPQARHVAVHTGQHYDAVMSDAVLSELGVAAPDHFLAVGSGTHGAQTSRALALLEQVMLEERPDLVVVPGDVNSSLAAALAAVKLQIPVAHIESGLRSGDWTMPEEINRVLIDRVSTWCFSHSPEARANLVREGVDPARVLLVGNTMIDTLVRMRGEIERSAVHARLGIPPEGYLLVTLHRPALVDGPLLVAALEALDRLSGTRPVVFPMHPRTRRHAAGWAAASPDLHLIDPVGYVDFLALARRAAAVLTDSGGVQEETTYLGVPCFTLRDNTERPITLIQGTNRLLGLDVAAIDRIPELLAQGATAPLRPPEGWDGQAAERVTEILAAALEADAGLPLAAGAARS
jgi:UDP-N-acetylglucosamine 2-epimerase (non-hydrolysing)